MRHALEEPGLRRGEDALDVHARRLEERAPERERRVPGAGVCVGEPGKGDDLAYEREPIRVQAGRSEAEEDVTGRDGWLREDEVPLDSTDPKAGEVVVVCASGRSARTYVAVRVAFVSVPSVRTHRRRRQVRTSIVHARHFSGLSTDQGTPGLNAAIRDALDDLCSNLDVELAAGEIIHEVQRLGALHEEVIYRHCDEINSC